MKAGRHLEALADVAERDRRRGRGRAPRLAGRAQRHDGDLRAWAGDREYFTTVLHAPGGEAMIWFVGAGPGDPELITVKGRRLLEEADVVVYAGSLVPKAVLGWTRDGCELHDSAAHDAGRADRGDGRGRTRPARRSCACTPATRACTARSASRCAPSTRAGIEYAVVPGVSSFVAAAAALPAELTSPGVSQTVIITRQAGRTPVPDGSGHRRAGGARRHHGRSSSRPATSTGTVAALCEHYPAETAAAIVQRASWPEQVVLRGTLATIAAQAAAAGVDRTAMILVGDALRNEGDASLLYDAGFTHGYRRAEEPGGADAARRGRPGPADEGAGMIHFARPAPSRSSPCPRRARGSGSACARASPSPSASRSGRPSRTSPRRACTRRRWRDFVGGLWRDHAAIVGVMASGIMVRAIAPHVASKYEDPAVVVVDDAGRFVISLLVGARGRRQPAGGADRRRDARPGGRDHRQRGAPPDRASASGARKGVSEEQVLAAVDEALAAAGTTRDDVRARRDHRLEEGRSGHPRRRASGWACPCRSSAGSASACCRTCCANRDSWKRSQEWPRYANRQRCWPAPRRSFSRRRRRGTG